MAKSKNHTNHNQNFKAHRNGIKKPKRQRYSSLRGVDQKFIRNQRHAKRHAVKPGVQSLRDKKKYRVEDNLIKQAMVKICRDRRLTNRNKNTQLKKSGDERKKLWAEAKKAGKTFEQFKKEQRAKNKAIADEIAKKRKEMLDTKSKEGMKKKVVPTEAKEPKKPLSPKERKEKKKAAFKARWEKSQRSKINTLALRRIKASESETQEKRSFFKKKRVALRLRKEVLKKEILNRLRAEKRKKKLVNKKKRAGEKKEGEKKEGAEKEEPKAAVAKKEKPKKVTDVKKETRKEARAKKRAEAKKAATSKKPVDAKKVAKSKKKKTQPWKPLNQNLLPEINRSTQKLDNALRKEILAELKAEKKSLKLKRKERKAAKKSKKEAPKETAKVEEQK